MSATISLPSEIRHRLPGSFLRVNSLPRNARGVAGPPFGEHSQEEESNAVQKKTPHLPPRKNGLAKVTAKVATQDKLLPARDLFAIDGVVSLLTRRRPLPVFGTVPPEDGPTPPNTKDVFLDEPALSPIDADFFPIDIELSPLDAVRKSRDFKWLLKAI
jgi:hypothetical protein